MSQQLADTQRPLVGSAGWRSLKGRQRRQEQMENLGVVQPSDHKLIPLLHGKFAKVDNDDFDIINESLWTASKFGYAITRRNGVGLWMHRIVSKCPDNLEVDHINGDKLDNRKLNLRHCTKVQNQGNRWKSKHAKTSIYKGVYFCKKIQRFAAYGREGAKNKRLGSFKIERDAAAAYNRWAAAYFGEFAKLNPL